MTDSTTLFNNIATFIGAVAIPLIGIGIASLGAQVLTKGIKASLRIAVIGAPRSGKTTMISIVFDRLMSGRAARNISVSGAETVDRMTRYLNILKSGVNLGPTTDKDVFAFRFLAKKKIGGIFPIKYDVEVADFPGEYSEEIMSGESVPSILPGIYKKEFFSWIVRADRYIFTVDAQAYFDHPDKRSAYISSVELSMKNAVLLLKQELLDESVYSRRCLLVFTKCDKGIFQGSRVEF